MAAQREGKGPGRCAEGLVDLGVAAKVWWTWAGLGAAKAWWGWVWRRRAGGGWVLRRRAGGG